ncbi:MAG TPA: aldo/keto reductase [Kofleriaceae bacterium]|nr:aldo/keto reductase [Kofleriaceae bacterium]
MEHRFLGSTGVRLSRLALGAMSFGDAADEAEAGRMFARCVDAGVNHVDTADVYSRGRSEEIVGRLIKACRDRVVLASKAYFPTDKGDPNARGTSRYHLVRSVEASLRRLGTDRIDLFYLHRFDDETALDETLRAVDDLVRAGKILYPAVSNFAAWQVAKALGVAARLGFAPVVCVQPMYNLVKRQAEVEILPMCLSERVGAIVYSPTAGGLLTGKYSAAARPSAGRLVDNPMYRVRYADDRYYDVAGRFGEMAAARGVHPAALAVAWVASHPAVTSVLLGGRSLAQLEPTLGALDVVIDDELRAALDALSPPPPPATDRNEERSAHNFGRR